MEDNIIKTPLTSEEPFTLKALADGADYYTVKASMLFGIPGEQVTDEQRAEARKQLFDYICGRRADNPFSSQLDSKGCRITHKLD